MRYGSGATRVARPRPGGDPPRRARATRREQAVPAASLGSYLTHHWRCLGHSMGYIVKTPLASLMTVAVIGISLALPAGMYVLLKNVQS
ncbi:MAG TPA: hypothetical protein VKA13_08690, partial [Gammaproteobacteria bacterium]|nr:hypothetical protein [Gammaproteobacteria bacterium]